MAGGPAGRGRAACVAAASLAAASLALLLVADPVQAQEPPPPHVVSIVEASYSLFQQPTLAAMFVTYTGVCVNGNSLSVNASSGMATFDDPFDEAECGEAQLALPVPPGSPSIEVFFTA